MQFARSGQAEMGSGFGAPEVGVRLRVALWLGLVALLTALLYQSSLAAAATALTSPLDIVGEGMVHRWGVLVLCIGWLWAKRASIRPAMQGGPAMRYQVLGLIALIASPWLFSPGALLLGTLGVFALLFGAAARIPSLLFGIYAFAVLFPDVIEGYLAGPFATATVVPTTLFLQVLGYPLVRSGEELHVWGAAGDSLSVTVSAACAGPATMGLFIAAFALMVLDTGGPWRSIAGLFVIGLAGTWLQSLARIVLLLLAGYYQGEAALWSLHETAGYVLFSLWFVLFGYLYLRRVRSWRTRPATAG